MPEMQLKLVYEKLKMGGPHLYAREKIKKGTNLGPAFLSRSKTGNPKSDFIRTKLGKYLHQNHLFYNLKIKQSRYKFYVIAVENIDKDEELIVNYYPWQLSSY